MHGAYVVLRFFGALKDDFFISRQVHPLSKSNGKKGEVFSNSSIFLSTEMPVSTKSSKIAKAKNTMPTTRKKFGIPGTKPTAPSNATKTA